MRNDSRNWIFLLPGVIHQMDLLQVHVHYISIEILQFLTIFQQAVINLFNLYRVWAVFMEIYTRCKHVYSHGCAAALTIYFLKRCDSIK